MLAIGQRPTVHIDTRRKRQDFGGDATHTGIEA
jgi:hypothetical protein